MRSAQLSAPARMSLWRRLALTGALLAICAFLAWSYIAGARMRAQTQELAAKAIAEENIALCGRYGMGSGTTAHADCVAELDALRARHERRLRSEAEALP